MRNILNSTTIPALSRVDDLNLIEMTLCAVLSIQSFQKRTARAERVARVAAKQGHIVGTVKRCSPFQRCRSLGCLICRFRAQLHFVANHVRSLKHMLKGERRGRSNLDVGRLSTVTIIPPWGRLPVGGEDISLPEFISKLRRLLRQHAPAAAWLLCVDLSWNTGPGAEGSGHWQLHVHGVVVNLSEQALARLGMALRGTGRAAHKPIWITPLTDPAGQLAYMAKPDLVLRVSYLDKDGKPNTRIEQPSLSQEVAMSRWLSSYTVDQRIIRIGSLEAVMARRASAAGVILRITVKTKS